MKNGKVLNTCFCVAYIVLSYVFMLWHGFEFMFFDIEILSAIRFLTVYVIFMLAILWFLKISNSTIASVVIGILSIFYLKEFSMGPMQIIINSKFSDSLQPQSILTFGFLVQIIMIILNLAILFFSILKLHDQLESKKV